MTNSDCGGADTLTAMSSSWGLCAGTQREGWGGGSECVITDCMQARECAQ